MKPSNSCYFYDAHLKKLAAILLACVLLFNWYGFQPLLNWLDNRADKQMISLLDEQKFNESSLIEISVPTNLPYTVDWTSFERVDGTLELDGQIYNYVMRKMVNGSMIYKCIPNENRNNISDARNEMFKQTFDLHNVSSSKKQDTNKTSPVKKTMDDFTEHQLDFNLPLYPQDKPSYLINKTALVIGTEQFPYHPPQV